MPQTPAPPPERHERAQASTATVAMLGALTAFGAISTDFYLPGLPAIGRDLSASPAEVELTLAVFFLGVSIGQLFYGPLADRIGRRLPLLFGIGLYTAASIGCAFATSIEALIALRLLQALGGCAGMVLSRAVVRDRYEPQQTAQIFSLLMLVMGVAPILAPLAGGLLLTVAGWRALFWVLAAFGAACGLAVLLALKESLPPSVAEQARSESPLRAYLTLLRKPRLVGYALFAACSSATLLTYISTSPDLLIRTYKVPPAAFGWLFGVNAIGMIAASQVNRRLLRFHSYDRILGWANVGGIAAASVLAVTAFSGVGGMVGVLVPLFLVICSLGFNQANALAGAMSVDPLRSGSTAALVGGIQFAVGASASAAASALHDGTPRPMALVAVTAMVAAGAALHFLAKPGDPSA